MADPSCERHAWIQRGEQSVSTPPLLKNYKNIGFFLCKTGPYPLKITKIVSDNDQKIPQSQSADNPVAPRGRAT